jgi:hypothetical protein
MLILRCYSTVFRSQLIRAIWHPPCTAAAYGVHSLSTSGHRVITNKRCAVNQCTPRGQRNAAWSMNGHRLVHEFSSSLLTTGSARSTLDPRVRNAQNALTLYPRRVAEASQIFLRDTHVLPKLFSYE